MNRDLKSLYANMVQLATQIQYEQARDSLVRLMDENHAPTLRQAAAELQVTLNRAFYTAERSVPAL